ncbi:MAG: hypothetical protein ACOYKN_00935 [Pirellula sp.]|jgi:hypothetical protein
MTEGKRLYAAITGDLVKSTKLNRNELALIRRKLEETVKVIGSWEKGLVKGGPDFFRGDAWQLLLTDPSYSLRACIIIRAALLSMELGRSENGKLSRADTRLAVGIGTVDSISTKRITESVGEAFVSSGRTLDKLKPHCKMAFSVSEEAGKLPSVKWCRTVWHLIDALIAHWTLGQAEIACLAVAPCNYTQAEIAESLAVPKDQQTVSRSLNNAGWQAISEAVLDFEAISWTGGGE